jgi:acyl carrier protein
MSAKSSRYPRIEGEVKSILMNLSGRDLSAVSAATSFFDLGFDSLLLTQASQSLRQKFGLKISFRQLLEDLPSIEAVADYLDEHVSTEKIALPSAVPGSQGGISSTSKLPSISGTTKLPSVSKVPAAKVDRSATRVAGDAVQRVMRQQLGLMSRQLDLLRSAGSEGASVMARIRELGAEPSPALVGPAVDVDADLTVPVPEAEKGLWLLSCFNDDANRAYQLSVTLSFHGKLNEEALSDALYDVVERHGALRTTIDPNGVSQTIQAQVAPQLSYFDFSDLPPGLRDTTLVEKMTELENELFPGLRGPFFRATLFRLEPQRHFLLLTFHHLICNGPSYLMFNEELTALYAEYAYGIPANLPPAVPFSEFIRQREHYAGTEASAAAEAFWTRQFATGVPSLELPFDHPHPPEITYRGARQSIILPPALNTGLRRLGAAHQSSLFMVLFAAYGALLHRLSGQDDLVIGVPFDSLIRVEEKGRNLFANTTNMLPLRSVLYEGSTFVDYLRQVRALILEASEHQDYFFGNLVGKLNLTRSSSRSLFFNATFNLERGEFKKSWPDLEMALQTENVPSGSPRGIAMFDLYTNASERINGEIVVECDHNISVVEPLTVQRWLRRYEVLIEGILANPNQPVSVYPLLTREELQEMVVTR